MRRYRESVLAGLVEDGYTIFPLALLFSQLSVLKMYLIAAGSAV
jgi:hypothetical protein